MIGLLSLCLLGSCSKEDDVPEDVSGAEITATFQFSNGKKVNYAFTHEKDDIILPSVNGPNGNNHYKLWLRGEREIEGSIYTINIYVTMQKAGVGRSAEHTSELQSLMRSSYAVFCLKKKT